MSQEYLDQYEDVKFQSLKGADARKTVLVLGIMTAHALGEGSGVGVSFCGTRGWSQVHPCAATHCMTFVDAFKCCWAAKMALSTAKRVQGHGGLHCAESIMTFMACLS